MDKFKWSVIAIVTILIPFGIFWATKYQKSWWKVDLQAKTDKVEYISKEEIKIEVTVYADRNIKDLIVKVLGIEDKLGNTYISSEKKVNIAKNQNVNLQFSGQLPECSSCAGLDPGKYEIKIEAWQANHKFTETKVEINIKDNEKNI